MTASYRPSRIISGGQTGADRGGLETALYLGIEIGGWCPYGRRAEDGRIPDKYTLRETASVAYNERTLLNVRDSDATVVFTLGALTSGSRLTINMADNVKRPWLHVRLSYLFATTPPMFLAWCVEHKVRTLNVAGSRESRAPGIQMSVQEY